MSTQQASRPRRGGRRVPPPVAEDRGHDTPCLIWQGQLTPKGYGRVRVGGRMLYAHRVAYERAHGPIPAGLQLDHLCRVRSCVNPEHGEPVTNAENGRRGASARLTMETARAIRADPRTAAAVAEAHGVTRACVHDVRQGRRWKEQQA